MPAGLIDLENPSKMTDSQLRTVDSVLLKESVAHQTGSACVFLCTCGHTLSHKGGGILG